MDIAYFIASIFSAGISVGYFPIKAGVEIPIWFAIASTIVYGLIGSFVGGKVIESYRPKYWGILFVVFLIPPLLVISWLGSR